MILYLDTSALVKLYVEEDHSDWVHACAAEAEVLATSVVALPEMLSALSRKRREGALAASDFSQVVEQLGEDWENLAVAAVQPHRAGDLATSHPLRGLDAVHLAAALEFLQEGEGVQECFLSFDKRLNAAAAAERLVVKAPQGFLS
jgi:predicted nucleic acid-binding protein